MGGQVGEIVNSCLDDRSCKYMGRGGNLGGGKVGDLYESCVGVESCEEMADNGGVGKSI